MLTEETSCVGVHVKQNKITPCDFGQVIAPLWSSVFPSAQCGSWSRPPPGLPEAWNPVIYPWPLFALLIFWVVPSFPRGKKSHHRLVSVRGEALGLDHTRINCES